MAAPPEKLPAGPYGFFKHGSCKSLSRRFVGVGIPALGEATGAVGAFISWPTILGSGLT